MSNPNYSAENLSRFLQMAGEKGLMNPGNARALRFAAQKVMEALEEHERLDVRAIDRQAVFSRFQNMNGFKYTPDSLNAYRSRFNTSLDAFISYAGDPSGFKPQAKKPANGAGKPTSKTRPTVHKKPAVPAHIETPPAAADTLMIPIPIRDGALVRIFGIPGNLTQEEAKKIAAVVQAYAVG